MIARREVKETPEERNPFLVEEKPLYCLPAWGKCWLLFQRGGLLCKFWKFRDLQNEHLRRIHPEPPVPHIRVPGFPSQDPDLNITALQWLNI